MNSNNSNIEDILNRVNLLTLDDINTEENTKKQQIKKTKIRTCSHCNKEGHNIRTCKEKVEHVIENTKITNKNILLLPIEKITYKSNRKSVEYNGMELVMAVLVVNKNIKNNIDFINKINDESTYTNIKFKSTNELNKYKEDVIKKKDILGSYISNCLDSSCFQSIIANDISYVIISGKKNTNNEINILNSKIDIKLAKSDIYI